MDEESTAHHDNYMTYVNAQRSANRFRNIFRVGAFGVAALSFWMVHSFDKQLNDSAYKQPSVVAKVLRLEKAKDTLDGFLKCTRDYSETNQYTLGNTNNFYVGDLNRASVSNIIASRAGLESAISNATQEISTEIDLGKKSMEYRVFSNVNENIYDAHIRGLASGPFLL